MKANPNERFSGFRVFVLFGPGCAQKSCKQEQMLRGSQGNSFTSGQNHKEITVEIYPPKKAEIISFVWREKQLISI